MNQRNKEYKEFLTMLEKTAVEKNDNEFLKTLNEYKEVIKRTIRDNSKDNMSEDNHLDVHNLIVDELARLNDFAKNRSFYTETQIYRETLDIKLFEKSIKKQRNEIHNLLTDSQVMINSCAAGSKIKYRGSLPTLMKNFRKSKDGVIQKMNPKSFDADGFIELDKKTWNLISDLSLLSKEDKDRISLDELLLNTKNKLNIDSKESSTTEKEQLECLENKLNLISSIQEKLKLATGSIKGYTTDSLEEIESYKGKHHSIESYTRKYGDFYFLLQNQRKSECLVKAGNNYPVGEFENSGMKYTQMLMPVIKSYNDNTGKMALFNYRKDKHMSFENVKTRNPSIQELIFAKSRLKPVVRDLERI